MLGTQRGVSAVSVPSDMNDSRDVPVSGSLGGRIGDLALSKRAESGVC